MTTSIPYLLSLQPALARWILALAVVLLGTLPASAQKTWDGGGKGKNGDDWSKGGKSGNWSDAAAPSGTDALVFGGTQKLINTNDISGLTPNSITFDSSAGNFTLNGNSITLNGSVTNSSSTTQTINLPMTLSGTRTFDTESGNIIVSGVMSGSGGLTKAGSETLTLSAANTYTGATTINAGTLAYGVNNAISSGAVIVSGGTLNISTFSDTVGAVTLSSGAINGTTGVLTGASYAMESGSVSAILAGGAALTKTTSGTTTLTAANTYTGATTISAGTLQLGSGGTTGSIANTSSITNNAALVFNRSNALTVGSAISGSGSLTKLGAGTTTLTANNTYSGATTISAGTLQIGNGGTTGSIANTAGVTNNGSLVFNRSDALNVDFVISGSGSVTHSGSGILTLTANNTYTGATIVSAGTLLIGDTGSIASTSSITNNTAVIFDRTTDLTVDYTLAGTGTVTHAGSATTTLTTANTYTGTTTLLGGVLKIDTPGALGGGNLYLDGGVLGITSNFTSRTMGSGSNQVQWNTSGNGGGFAAYGGTHAVDLNDAPFINWNPQIGDGVSLILGADDADGTVDWQQNIQIGGGVQVGPRTFDVRNGSAAVDAIVSGVLSGPNVDRFLQKTGTGTMVLTAANTYTGATEVVAGTLLLNGSHAGGGLYTVSAGATLGGAGSTESDLSIAGILSPGASIETFESGAVSFTDLSTFEYEVDSDAALGVAADLMLVNGDLDLTDTVELSLADLASSPAMFAMSTTFTLINYDGVWNDGLFTVGGHEILNAGTFTVGLNTWRLDYDATAGGENFSGQYVHANYVNIVAVPEPGTIVMLVSAAALGFCLIRRKRA